MQSGCEFVDSIGGGPTLKKSKKVSVDFGNFWVGIDFFRPTILTHFSGFSVGLHNNFSESIAWYHGFTAKFIIQ